MNVLRMGDTGADVKRWQYFLIGQGLLDGIADGKFGPATKSASIQFQRMNALQPDGIVGNKTIGAAMLLGFGVLTDTIHNKSSPNWPAKPRFRALNDAGREDLFGKFRYKAAPLPGNRENITVLDGWPQKNIIMADIPQLTAIKGSPKVQFHKKRRNSWCSSGRTGRAPGCSTSF